MVELELGPVATYATVWGANVKRESCPGACPARTQNIYQRDVLTNDLTWFYPLATETTSPYHNNLVQPGDLLFQIASTVTIVDTCKINFYQPEEIDPLYVYDDQTTCDNLNSKCDGRCKY